MQSVPAVPDASANTDTSGRSDSHVDGKRSEQNDRARGSSRPRLNRGSRACLACRKISEFGLGILGEDCFAQGWVQKLNAGTVMILREYVLSRMSEIRFTGAQVLSATAASDVNAAPPTISSACSRLVGGGIGQRGAFISVIT
jgi:hypothetical protein